MQRFNLGWLFIILSCSSSPELKPEPESVPEPPVIQSENIISSEVLAVKEIIPAYQQGLLTDYDVWEFLKEKPTETEILSLLGPPDSVWVDENEEIRILYYYLEKYHDYNSIEIETSTGLTAGFEWD